MASRPLHLPVVRRASVGGRGRKSLGGMDEVKRVHALVQHADALMAEAHREMRHGNVNVASEVLRVAARTYRAAGRDTSARVAEHLLAQQNGGEALAMVEREMAKGHYDHAVR